MKIIHLLLIFIAGFSFLFLITQKTQAVQCISFKTNCNDYTQYFCNQVQSGPMEGYYTLPCVAQNNSDCNLCEPGGGQCGYCYHVDSGSCQVSLFSGGGYYAGCSNGTFPGPDSVCGSLGFPPGYTWINSAACYAPTCDSGISCTGWSACGGSPTNTCYSGNGSQSRTCHYTTYSGGGNCNQSSDFTQSQSCTDSNCSTNYSCSGGNCVTSISVHIYIDYGHDGSHDANYPYGVVTINGGNAQTTGSDGTVTYTGLRTGSYTIAYSDNSTDYQQIGGTSQTVNLTNSSGNASVSFRVTPLYRISGNVFYDANHNQNYDGSDSLYTGTSTIHVTGGPTSVTDMTQTDGTYDTGEALWSGTYTVSQTHSLPTSYTYTTPTSWTVTVGDRGTAGPNCSISTSPDAACGNPNDGSISGLNFGINEPYQIQGRVYNDVNKNSQYDAGVDQEFTEGPTIQITGPTNKTITASTSDGTYTTGQTLLPGNYTVTYTTALPLGYSFENKKSTYSVVLGYNPACSVGGSSEASCGSPNSGSINNLNFGLTNENTQPPQPICGDIRTDSGYNNFIPATEDCNGTSAPYAIVQDTNICPVMPGVLYSGSTNPSYGAGSGASTTGQQVGNTLFPETYNFPLPNTNQTSYDFVNTTITNNALTTPTNLTSICPNLTNCVLSKNTPGGIYKTTAADGAVKISISNTDGSFDLGQSNYIFLIGGDLTFSSNVLSPTGYTATFISGGDIHVASNVGQTDWNSITPNLEGVFSADTNFIMETLTSGTNLCQFSGQPLDKKLNIVGSVITNAGGNGGSIVNNREGCIQDLYCPGITVQQDPRTILELTGNVDPNGNYTTLNNPNGILKPPYSFWQELNP